MKSVLISIQPKWCELIASGKKTVEVRKTRPKLETPFKCYIYCTKQKVNGEILLTHDKKVEGRNIGFRDVWDIPLAGKVIGEFVCDRIDEYRYGVYEGEFCYHIPTAEGEKTCLEYFQAEEYGNGKPLYFWHISDLVIYDKPKELYHFQRPCDNDCDNCDYLDVSEVGAYEHTAIAKTCLNFITRPPQSWCYVEWSDTE